MSICIVGTGMGSPGTLTAEALKAIEKADAVIGADRLISSLPDSCRAAKHVCVDPDEIKGHISRHPDKSVCVLMSGDTGFYSGTKRLLEKIGAADVRVLPGISSIQYFAALLKRPWQDWKLVSAHGKNVGAAGIVRENSETFFLTGGDLGVRAICAQLTAAGLGGLSVTVGENLGGDNERIKTSPADMLTRSGSDELAVMLVDNPQPGRLVSCGFPDDAFIRGATPMTKSEVRSVILSKLRLCGTDVVYDVGAGTGSVSVESALLARKGRVYSFERTEEGRRLIGENADKFGVPNIRVVSGEAPASFADLPAPDASFIGGSGGSLKKILDTLLAKNPHMRFVISAVALETLSEAAGLLKNLPVCHTEIVQVAVSRARFLGDYHLMTACNPVYILSAEGRPVNNT